MPTSLPLWISPFVIGLLIGALVIWVWRQTALEKLKIQLAELKKEQETTQEKLHWAEEAEAHLREAFESLAGKALQTNNEEFLKHARSQVEILLGQMRGTLDTHKSDLTGLVHPLRENLSLLDGYVRELEGKREGAYQGLQTQLQQLSQTHTNLQNTTSKLAEALKNPAIRGRWGELQLRRLIEMAGMVQHVDFDEQINTSKGRPDMIIKMPNGGRLPVDAKIPLNLYLEAIEATDDLTRQTKLKDHVKATRERIRELGLKKYWDQFDEAPDFVVMFVPNEASLNAAFELEPKLLDEALAQRVLITTPVTLLALLKTVAYGWQQYHITTHAREIVQQTNELHRRLTALVEYLVSLGKSINKFVDGYNEVTRALDRQVLPALQHFQELGLPTLQLDLPILLEGKVKLPVGIDTKDIDSL